MIPEDKMFKLLLNFTTKKYDFSYFLSMERNEIEYPHCEIVLQLLYLYFTIDVKYNTIVLFINIYIK